MTIPIKALAASAILFAGCTEPASESGWHGIIRRTCGPADGPALEIKIDTGPYAACSTTHSGETRIYTDAWTYDSVQAGKAFDVPKEDLCTSDCNGPEWASFRLEIVSKDSSLIVGAFKAQSTTGKTVSGSVRLKACSDRPICG